MVATIRTVAAAGLLVALSLGGCSATVAGDPIAGGPGRSSRLPPPPREVRIDDFDLCTAFTSSDLDRLAVGGQIATQATDSRGPICQWIGSSARSSEGYLIERITDSGPEFAFGNRRGTTVITVAGFPAVQTQGNNARVDAHCIVLLGVAQGQTLQVQYDYYGPPESMTKDIACTKAAPRPNWRCRH